MIGKHILSAGAKKTPARQKMQGKPKSAYVGSVLFFKHVILGVVIVSIAVPAVLAVWFGVQLHGLRQQVTELQVQLAETATAALLESTSESSPEFPAESPSESTSAYSNAEADTSAEVSESEVPAYTELYPELYAEPADYGSDDVAKSVYLTFDDGPSERTDEILEILDRYGIHATFFVVGQSDEEDLQRMRNIVAAGHTLAIHSFSHEYREIYSSVEAFLEDFNQIYCLIVETTGVKPQIFRFPGGSINGYNQLLYHEILSEMLRRGFVYFDWNLSNGDATSK